MEKTFEEVLIDQINPCDKAIKNYNYQRDEAFFTFVSRINDIMKLDIDDVVFRRTVGTFFTELVKEVMENVKTD